MSSSKSSGSKSAGAGDAVSSKARSSSPAADALRAILIAASEAVRTWNDTDVAAFLAGESELTLKVRARPARRKPIVSLDGDQVDEVRRALGAMETREAGSEYLDRMGLGREGLRMLAGGLDLPTNRSDTIERLRNRIVESLIGYRLRSSAIRGTESRGKTGLHLTDDAE
jgi:hypothetical protein